MRSLTATLATAAVCSTADPQTRRVGVEVEFVDRAAVLRTSAPVSSESSAELSPELLIAESLIAAALLSAASMAIEATPGKPLSVVTEVLDTTGELEITVAHH